MTGAGSLSWRTALRIALREVQFSKAKFLFVILAVAVGVGSLAGVRGFGRAFRTMLLAEARTLMAADLSVRVFELPSTAQQDLFLKLEREGVRRTQITETVSMISASTSEYPVLVSLKAVDPSHYPFYGAVKLDPPGRLAEVLRDDTVAVSEDLLIRLNVNVGAPVRLGGQEFRIAGLVAAEPDRMAGSLNVGPRVMLTRHALARSELIKPGSRAAQRHLFKLPPQGRSVAEVREDLNLSFPQALIADFRETHPLITRGLTRSERFLSLVSLIALIVGALGVAATMHSHLQQRLDSIAIMKCLGARSAQILRIYFAQTMVLGLAGGIVGAVAGGFVQAAFPLLIMRFFSLTPEFRLDARAAGEAMLIGILVAVLFTIPALLGVRRIRPAVIFRRDMSEASPEWRERWWRSPSAWLSALAILCSISGIAAWLAGGNWEERTRVGGYFAGGLVVSLLVLALFAWGLLKMLRILVKLRGAHMHPTLRQGIANLYRPGNQAQAVLVSLGIGVMFTLTVFLIQRGLLDQLVASSPPNMPNVFLINITVREKAGIEELLKSHPAVKGDAEVIAIASAKLETVEGKPIPRPIIEGSGRRFRQARGVSFSEEPRPQTDVLEGTWWSVREKRNPAAGQVCLSQDAARDLKLKVGNKLTFTSGLRTIDASVSCIFRTEEIRMGGSMEVIFSPGTLDGVPMQFFAAARMTPKLVAEFQRVSFKRFPSITVINGADVLEIVQGVVDQIALVVRFISGFAILAGAIILASSVASTRFRRVKEVAILKTLGATKRRVAAIFSTEFLILGAAAGLLGGILATLFSNLLLTRLLESKFVFDALPNVASVVLSAVIANAAGWLASWKILREKPLEVLRHE
jgi:putative ABC transport system permease protein